MGAKPIYWTKGKVAYVCKSSWVSNIFGPCCKGCLIFQHTLQAYLFRTRGMELLTVQEDPILQSMQAPTGIFEFCTGPWKHPRTQKTLPFKADIYGDVYKCHWTRLLSGNMITLSFGIGENQRLRMVCGKFIILCTINSAINAIWIAGSSANQTNLKRMTVICLNMLFLRGNN